MNWRWRVFCIQFDSTTVPALVRRGISFVGRVTFISDLLKSALMDLFALGTTFNSALFLLFIRRVPRLTYTVERDSQSRYKLHNV